MKMSFSLIRQKVLVSFRFTKKSPSVRPGCWTTKEPVSVRYLYNVKLSCDMGHDIKLVNG